MNMIAINGFIMMGQVMLIWELVLILIYQLSLDLTELGLKKHVMELQVLHIPNQL